MSGSLSPKAVIASRHKLNWQQSDGCLTHLPGENAIPVYEAGAMPAALYAHLELYKWGLVVAFSDSLICSTGRLLLGAFHHLRGCCANSAGFSPGWPLTLLPNQGTPCRVC